MSYNPPPTPKPIRSSAKRNYSSAQAGDYIVCNCIDAYEDNDHRGYVFFDLGSTISLHGLRLHIVTPTINKYIDIYYKERDALSFSGFIANTRPNTFSATMTQADGRIIEQGMNVIYMPKNPFYRGNDLRLKHSYIRFGPDERTQHIFYPIGDPRYHP